MEEVRLSGISGSGYDSSVIAAGDLLEVTIATGRENEDLTPIKTRVANTGTITLPMIGPVPVAGLEPFEAGEGVELLAIERGIYRQPQVNVEVVKKAVNRVTVLGKVKEPGVHELPRGGTDVLTALAAAGGLTEEAGTVVEIRRQTTGPLTDLPADASPGADSATEEEIQLAAFQEASGARSPAFAPPPAPNPATRPMPNRPPAAGTLQVDLANPQQLAEQRLQLGDGDVVHVFPRPERMVYVGGLVRQPGQYEIPRNQDMDLLQAIQMAGDKSSPVADKVVVIRQVSGRAEPIVIETRLSKAKENGRENIRLAAGDVVSVEQTAATVVVDTLKEFFHVSLGVAGRATTF
jgi:polysaccharide export outer membrane protein